MAGPTVVVVMVTRWVPVRLLAAASRPSWKPSSTPARCRSHLLPPSQRWWLASLTVRRL